MIVTFLSKITIRNVTYEINLSRSMHIVLITTFIIIIEKLVILDFIMDVF